MGIGIMIPGAHFTDERYIIGKVKIPEEPVPECEHIYDNECDTTCNLCGAVRTVPHNLVHYDAVAPTDTADGNKEYWHCTLCGGYWLDEALTQPTTKDGVVSLSIGSYPVKDGLKGLYVLGGSQEVSLVNHANTAIVPTVTGAVEYAENYAIFSGKTNASRIDTSLLLPLENGVTLIALFSVPTDGRPLIGNRRSTFGLDLRNDGARICVDGVAEHENHYFDNPVNSSNFAIVAMTADTNGYRVVRYTNGGLTPLKKYEGTVDTWNTASSMTSSNGFKIGGNGNSDESGTAYISLAAIHEGDMTDEQLESICQFVKTYGEQKGLTIE